MVTCVASQCRTAVPLPSHPQSACWSFTPSTVGRHWAYCSHWIFHLVVCLYTFFLSFHGSTAHFFSVLNNVPCSSFCLVSFCVHLTQLLSAYSIPDTLLGLVDSGEQNTIKAETDWSPWWKHPCNLILTAYGGGSVWSHIDRPCIGRASPHMEAGGLPESRWSPERRLPHCLDTWRLGPRLSLGPCLMFVSVTGMGR